MQRNDASQVLGRAKLHLGVVRSHKHIDSIRDQVDDRHRAVGTCRHSLSVVVLRLSLVRQK
jgi:hypothetical protein